MKEIINSDEIDSGSDSFDAESATQERMELLDGSSESPDSTEIIEDDSPESRGSSYIDKLWEGVKLAPGYAAISAAVTVGPIPHLVYHGFRQVMDSNNLVQQGYFSPENVAVFASAHFLAATVLALGAYAASREFVKAGENSFEYERMIKESKNNG